MASTPLDRWSVIAPPPVTPRNHAFRTAVNSPIDSATDDLGTLGGTFSRASRINVFGQVVGSSYTACDGAVHAFRTAPNRPINPVTDDLGTLGGSFSMAWSIDDYGQVVGSSETASGDGHAFLYSGGVMHDLNNLIPTGSNCELVGMTFGNPPGADINDAGQIVAANSICGSEFHSVVLTPIYKAFVQQPIQADGSSLFSTKRGVVPVKFSLTKYNVPTCTLPPATIAITRADDGTLTSVDENIYSTPANKGPNFRITACSYHYNLATRPLGVGTYRVDISISGIMVGHAVFGLK
jgi:probable HAF family extracellular repeat protein